MSYLQQVNSRQREAITAVQGPVMVVAGPGSGKTRVLTYRIAHLIEIGVPPYQILSLTFTNKAAREMMNRIVELVGDRSRSLWMGTFHSVFARLLRMDAEVLGYGKNFAIYDTLDSQGLIRTIMSDLGIPTQQYNPQAIRSRISGAKNQLIGPGEYEKRATDIFEEKTAAVFSEYQKRLRRSNAMDFDDLLIRPIDLLTQHPKILDKYQDRFRFILIDEYQDTNHAQYVLINMIARKYKNLCVVGDDAQSIYAFRGADIRNILDFNRDYPEALTIRLEQNYRSTQNILAAANQVISRNVDQIAKTIWTENTRGDEITVLACQDDRDEGASVVRSIFEETRRTGKEFRDFAVMYRTNAQSRSLEDALRRSSIPYIIVGGVEFYQRKEVKDVLAYIRLLVNPRDEESFLRVINTPVRGLGDTAVERLRKFAESRGLGLYDSLVQLHESEDLKARALTAFGEFYVLIEKYRRLRGEMSASEISRTLVDELGILRRYKDEGTPEALARWENVQELLSAITEFTTMRDGATLEDFLQDVSLVSDIDTYDEAANAVTLMTLHSAKGLEFPVVFLTGLEEGLLPFYSSSPDRKDLEEERRLCYVGMTRAKLKLYMSWARMRFRFAEMSYQSPSRFLEEIEPDLIRTSHSIRPAISQEPQRRSSTAASPYRKREKTDTDSHYYRDTIPDDDDAQVPVSHFKAGKIVDHETFGRGKILHVTGSGETLKAVVEFPSVGKKQLLLKYARLRVV